MAQHLAFYEVSVTRNSLLTERATTPTFPAICGECGTGRSGFQAQQQSADFRDFFDTIITSVPLLEVQIWTTKGKN